MLHPEKLKQDSCVHYFITMKKNLWHFSNAPAIFLFALMQVFLPFSVLSAASPGPFLFDMGNEQSTVWKGFKRVTPENIFNSESGFGWESDQGLASQSSGITKPAFSQSRGTTDQPSVWTNEITEDAVTGTRENSFIFQAPAGDYEIYIVCGISEVVRNQFYDFTVSVGKEKKRVQFEGGQQYNSLRFHVKKGKDPLAIQFSPLSKWVVNAVMAWNPADDALVQKEIITPFEDWTYKMPPEEWAKFKLDPFTPDPEPTAGATDLKRGFIVYSRHYLECIYPYTKPGTKDINPKLSLFATPGEFEPVNFAVYPLKDLKSAKVTVSPIGPVPARDIDIRYVRYIRARPNYTTRYRYRIVPDCIQHFDRLDLTKNESTRFWLTVHIPDNAPAGTFSGKITFECSGGKVELPVTLNILPFKLKEDPSKIYGIYYGHPLDQTNGADEVSKAYFRRKAELEHADMAAHGTRNVTMSFGGQAADAQGNFNFNLDIMTEKMALWKKYNFQGPVVMSISAERIYEKHMKERYGSHLLNLKIPPEAFGREVTAMVRAIETERKKNGWPEFLYYPVDEPGRDSTSIKYMIILLKACRDAGVRTYLTANPVQKEFQPLKPYVDVWCTQPFSPDRETVLADSKARNVEYWCYPNHVGGENDHTPVTGSRMTYGFGFWRSGFKTLIPWIYSWRVGDPFNYLDGFMSDFFNHYEPDGTPIPVVMWEAYREGFDDYRYIYTLEQLISRGKASTDTEISRACSSAEKELTAIWDAISVQEKYKYDGMWAPAEFDNYRWKIAQQIISLNKVIQ